jgi:hypothetical protein
MEMVARKLPAVYDHQALIPVQQNGNTISVSAGGTLKNNTYRWIRVTKTSKILVATISGDSVFHPLQNGIYLARVTNSVATGLTLRSDTIHYTVSDDFAESASAFSENLMQQNDKTKFFLVYPNPAKNILHVRINGNALFSLSDQSGKILLTTSINREGSINISGMAAGLYYLRNNSTGAAQKIIIER